jgi:hypothetical protein
MEHPECGKTLSDGPLTPITLSLDWSKAVCLTR